MTINDLVAEHHQALKSILSQPARFSPWIVESALLLTYTRAHRAIAAGSRPNRAELLAWAVRQATDLKRMVKRSPRRIG